MLSLHALALAGRFAESDPGGQIAALRELEPMAFEKHRDRVLSYSALARCEGAEILTGGGRPKGFDNGWYIEPTAALVNSNALRDLRAPFGGFKNSGIGREGPKQCADFYSEEKAAIFARGKVPIRALGARR